MSTPGPWAASRARHAKTAEHMAVMRAEDAVRAARLADPDAAEAIMAEPYCPRCGAMAIFNGMAVNRPCWACSACGHEWVSGRREARRWRRTH